MTKNIILIGFMGTGKSTVGQALAQALGWTFVDTDEQIEKQANMTIPEIFKHQGEAYFRSLETQVIRQLISSDKQVISTGGGAVLREENRSAMLEGGLVVGLKADASTIIQRVSGDVNRPLLAGDPESRVRGLLKEREHAYDFAPMMIDTSPLKVDEIVERILEQYSQA